MADKIALKFNPDGMTVADLKRAANTLRSLLMDYDKNTENWEEVGCQVAQIRDIYIVEK